MLTRRLTSDLFDRQLMRHACFIGAVAVLLIGFNATIRFASTEFEIIVGLLATIGTAISGITLGTVVGESRPVST